jgi:tetratricopeptide (TPR) repeat protein
MARLSHPNVVAVFDVGTFDGQVFLAMEFIDGVTLREWRGSEPRAVRDVVAMYIQAGRGLEAAHAAGILHRDFKPDNVVVDATGRARVLDFGVARVDAEVSADDLALATTGMVSTPSRGAPLTEFGALVGTPAYMAPEQLRGERAEARSDQFAFAVALYEALHGGRPFIGKSLRDLIEAIQSARFHTPAKGSSVPGSVRAAVQRALRAKPDDRFPTMGALLDALERGVARRLGYAIAAGAVALVVALVAVVVVQARTGTRARVCEAGAQEIATVWGPTQRQAVERSFAATGVPHAADTNARAAKILDDYAVAWGKMRDESCAATRVRGVQSDEALDLRTACLDQRRDELAATIRLFSSANAKLVDDALTAARGLGDIASCADVSALRAPYATPRDPAARARVQAVRTKLAEGRVLIRARHLADAETMLNAALAEAKSLDDAQLRATALDLLGMCANGRGDYERSRSVLLDAALDASAVRDDGTEAMAWSHLVFAVGYGLQKVPESELYARLAEAALRRAKNDVAHAILLRNRAHVLFAQGKLDDSLALYREALEIRRRIQGADSPEAADLEMDIAGVSQQKGRFREAISLCQAARAKRVAFFGEGSPTLAIPDSQLAGCYVALGDAASARENAERAVQRSTTQRVIRSEALGALAVALLLSGDRAQADVTEKACHEASPRGYQLAQRMLEWADGLLRRHHAEDARGALDAAIGEIGTNENMLTEANTLRALALSRLGKGVEAARLAQQSLTAQEKTLGPTDSRLLPALLALGEARLATNDPAGALGPLERASAIAETAEGYPESHADTHLALARAIAATHGDAARARALAERAAGEYSGARMPELAKTARDFVAAIKL